MNTNNNGYQLLSLVRYTEQTAETSPIKYLYSYSNTVVTLVHRYMLLKLENILEDRLALTNENDLCFPSEPIRPTPTAPPPLSSQAPSSFLRGKRLHTRCVARSFRLRTRFEHSSFQVFSQCYGTALSKIGNWSVFVFVRLAFCIRDNHEMRRARAPHR